MNKPLIVALAASVLIVSYASSHAKEDSYCVLKKPPTAKTPLGAIVECVGVFTGKLASAIEISATGERRITVENETGECRIFPFCATTKVVDGAFNTLTANQLKEGKSVKVEYIREEGTEKAQSVIVEK